MRMVFGAAMIALGMAAQPAFAGEGAVPLVTPAPLPTFVGFTGLAGPVLHDVRLPTVEIAPASPTISLDDPRSSLRRRFTGGRMMEYYPFGGEAGFHFSAGTRLFARRNFVTETENSASGALAGSRSIAAPIATRAGFRRFNPTATAGYSFALSKVAQIGVEGGAMMNRAFAGVPGLPTHALGFHGDSASFRPNAVANMVFGLHF